MTAHYDCRNCGHYLGIAFGQCEACTPPEYFTLKAEAKDINVAAAWAWQNESAVARATFIKQYLNDNKYDGIIRKLDDIRNSNKG